jgi:type VI secretion system secreted protein Hcp
MEPTETVQQLGGWNVVARDSRRSPIILLAAIIVATAVTVSLSLTLVSSANARVARAKGLPASLLSSKPIVASYHDPIYMNYQGIQGESTASGYANWIDVSSWSWGATQSGAQLGKFAPATVTVPMSRAVLPILMQLAQHKSSPTVTLDFVKTSPVNSSTYLRFVFSNVFTTNVSWSSGGDSPTESITFVYGKLLITYQYQSPTGGSTIPYRMCWNLASQTAC